MSDGHDPPKKQWRPCGGALHLIGEDRTEQLDIVPSQLRVKVVCAPAGRPKKTVELQAYCRDLLPEVVLVLADALKMKAEDLTTEKRRERMEAVKLILAYGFGRPVQTQHVRVIRGLQDLTEEELLAIAGSDPEDEDGDDDKDGEGDTVDCQPSQLRS